MILSLNLIPKDKKDEIGLTNFYITVKNVIILILLITIVVAITLLVTKAALQNHFNKVVAQSTLTTQYATTFSRGIKNFNNKLSAVSEIQNNYIFWSKFIVEFSEIVPEGVVIHSVDANTNTILITGQADTRDGLILFENRLKNSAIFENVQTPLENLLQRSEIDFDIKATLNLTSI